MRHAGAEVGDADVGLLRPPKIALRDEHVAHREHAETTKFLRRVKHDGREPRRHLRVQADLDTRLDLVLGLDESVEEFVRVHDGLAVVRHESDERRVPLVDDLRERGRTRAHEHLPDAVVELLHAVVRDAEEGLRGALLRLLIREVPHGVLERVLLAAHGSDLRQDTDLEPAHREQELRVLLRVDADEGVLPLDGRERAREAVLDVPEHRATEVDVVLDESHPAVARPAPLVVVPDDVVVRWVGVGAEVPLDQVSRLLRTEAEEDVELVDVTRVQADRVAGLGR
jgi:hypothetical protein